MMVLLFTLLKDERRQMMRCWAKGVLVVLSSDEGGEEVRKGGAVARAVITSTQRGEGSKVETEAVG